MRIFLVLAFMVTVVTFVYRWRFRIVNTLLAVSLLRRFAVMITMNMPAIRQKILPKLIEFTKPNHQTE